MSANLKRITEDALQLTPSQRAELADILVESLDSTPPDEVQRLWAEEVNKRLQDIRSGRAQTIPGDAVLAEARRLTKR